MSIHDGTYRYSWTTPFGRHSLYFQVVDGVITNNPSRLSNPVKAYEGRSFAEFSDARMSLAWRFEDDSLHQIPIGSIQKCPKCGAKYDHNEGVVIERESVQRLHEAMSELCDFVLDEVAGLSVSQDQVRELAQTIRDEFNSPLPERKS